MTMLFGTVAFRDMCSSRMSQNAAGGAFATAKNPGGLRKSTAVTSLVMGGTALAVIKNHSIARATRLMAGATQSALIDASKEKQQ
jgi:hypothetical protein